MLGTDVQRSFGDAYLEATAAMRSRFEARVLEAEDWTEGLALALNDLADGVLADPETARMTVTDVRFGHRDMLCLCDEDRQETIASLARGWQHHHDGARARAAAGVPLRRDRPRHRRRARARRARRACTRACSGCWPSLTSATASGARR